MAFADNFTCFAQNEIQGNIGLKILSQSIQLLQGTSAQMTNAMTQHLMKS